MSDLTIGSARAASVGSADESPLNESTITMMVDAARSTAYTRYRIQAIDARAHQVHEGDLIATLRRDHELSIHRRPRC